MNDFIGNKDIIIYILTLKKYLNYDTDSIFSILSYLELRFDYDLDKLNCDNLQMILILFNLNYKTIHGKKIHQITNYINENEKQYISSSLYFPVNFPKYLLTVKIKNDEISYVFPINWNNYIDIFYVNNNNDNLGKYKIIYDSLNFREHNEDGKLVINVTKKIYLDQMKKIMFYDNRYYFDKKIKIHQLNLFKIMNDIIIDDCYIFIDFLFNIFDYFFVITIFLISSEYVFNNFDEYLKYNDVDIQKKTEITENFSDKKRKKLTKCEKFIRKFIKKLKINTLYFLDFIDFCYINDNSIDTLKSKIFDKLSESPINFKEKKILTVIYIDNIVNDKWYYIF
jgi:hypothetical protein